VDVAPLLTAIDLSSGKTLGIAAENMDDPTGFRTGTDYLDAMLEMLTGPGKPLQKVSAITPVRFLAREFHRVDLAGEVLGVRQHRAVFATLEKGHVLVIMIGAKSNGEVDEVLTKVGLMSETPVAASAQKPGSPGAARKQNSAAPSSAAWMNDIKLQGIGGTETRRFAIINGRTLGPGEAASVKTSTKNVLVRCVAIGDASVTVVIEGLGGERKLSLN
jgi:hypothetical protein